MVSIEHTAFRVSGTAEEVGRLLPLLRATWLNGDETQPAAQPPHTGARGESVYNDSWHARHQGGGAGRFASARTETNIRAALERNGGISPAQGTIFRILAQRSAQGPNAETSLQELADGTHQDRRQTTGTLGGLGRRANQSLGLDRFDPGAPGTALFFDERHDDIKNEYYYRLRPETEAVLKVLGII